MKKLTLGLTIYDVYLEVTGYYYPEEPTEWYDDNMEGYPGSSPEFDLETVEVEGVNIIELLSDHVIKLIKEQVIENQEN
jgi:hypothetical protein